MRRPSSALLGLLAGPVLLLGGCENIVDHRGFAPSPGSTEKLEVGSQSREDVVRLIGTPSAVATFNPNIWYFISQRQETFAFLKPTITEQKVMQLTFSDAGRVTDIKHYELKDARDIDMVARVTPTAGKELTVLEQILGNIGKFSGPRQETNPGAPTGGGI
jgi:outer membrane protein assembly factor BamE (lipoprotein component of BamABCDE complex)